MKGCIKNADASLPKSVTSNACEKNVKKGSFEQVYSSQVHFLQQGLSQIKDIKNEQVHFQLLFCFGS